MKTPHHLPRYLVAAGAMAVAATGFAGIFSYLSEGETLTAVSAKRFNGYTREVLHGGAYAQETYALGNGGMVPPELYAVSDASIDDLGFASISRTIASALARQNYVTGRSARDTQILIMVFWGRSTGANFNTIDGPSVDALDYWNAGLMGYDTRKFSEISFEPALAGFGEGHRAVSTALSGYQMGDDLHANRYFVILRAYDFQDAWRRRTVKPLWETRFSLSERGHMFNEELPMMARNASLFFGQDSNGLVRLPAVPDGRIEFGDLKVIGSSP